MSRDYTIQIAVDMDQVLETVASSKGPISPAEIASATGLDRNKVFRILKTLAGLKYVEATGDHYKLGMKLALYWARAKARLESERAAIDKSLDELEVSQ